MAWQRAADSDPPPAGAGHVVVGSRVGALEPAVEHLAGLHRLSDPGLSELALEGLLDELLIRIRDILEVDTAAILLLDRPDGPLVARAAKGLEEEVEHEVRIPLGQGFAGRIAAERSAIYIADVDRADVFNPILREKGLRSLLGVPLVAEGELLGVLHVGTLQPRTFSQGDAIMLELAAARAALSIARAQVFDALEREHQAAIALQRSLLPERLPTFVDVEVAARYLPARDEVGGDWYDVVALPRGGVGIAIGDVVGHGARGAALMGHLRAGLRAYALEDHAPSTVLELLDRLLQTSHDRGMATVAYAVFDPQTGLLRIASAGHPPPLVVEAGGARFVDLAPCPPLGVRPFPAYREHTETVAAGDAVLLYTDGLVEVRGQPLNNGLERLRAAAEVAGPAAERLCAEVVGRLVPRGGAADDVAVVALRNLPVPDQLRLRLPAEPRELSTARRALRRWLYTHGATPDQEHAIVLAAGEACANAIEHAYGPQAAVFELTARREGATAVVVVRDYGRWRPSRSRDRGRGLEVMATAMDAVEHRQTPAGTEVVMRRRIGEDDGDR